MSNSTPPPQSDPPRSTPAAPPLEQPLRAPTRQLLPGPLVVAIATLSLLGIAVVRGTTLLGDHAVVNVVTLILAFVAVVTVLLWSLLLSDLPRVAVLAVCGAVAMGLIGAVALLRIEEVSGELVPRFGFRWSQPAYELLETPAEGDPVGDSVDLSRTTDLDSPQFFGPHRTGVFNSVRLDRGGVARELWRQPIGAGWSSFAVVNGFAVTMEQRGGEELVSCYDVHTGRLRWTHAEDALHKTVLGGVGPRSTPTIHEGKVYAVGATGILRCLDGSSGRLLWRQDLLANFGIAPGEDSDVAWGRAGSPLVVDSRIVVPAGGPPGGPYTSLVAYDGQSGEEVWRGGTQQVAYASPILTTFGGDRQVVSVNQDTVSGHDPETGRVLWEYAWPGKSNADANTSQPRPLSDDELLMSKHYGVGGLLLRVVPGQDGGPWNVSKVWQNSRVLKTKFTNVVVRDGYGYALSDGILECVDLRDGQRAWKQGRYGHGQVLLIDDLLLVQSEAGEIALVEASPEAYGEVTRFAAVSGKSWGYPVLYGRFLLVRNAEEMACFELPLSPR